MTDETRADWRAALDDLLRQAMTDRPFHLVYGRRPHHEYAALTETFVAVVHHDDTADYPEPPPLTTAQQLALSVLLGDDIPLGVLLSACEDAGVFADGLAGEIAEKARAEERERVIGHIDRLVSGLTLRMGQYGYSGPNYERASTQAAPLALLKGAVESGRAAT